MNILQDKNVMVTGAAGFIGSHLVDSLLNEGINRLVAVDNLFLGQSENLKQASQDKKLISCLGTEFDCCDYEVMETLIEEHSIDIVFDLATIPLPVSLKRPAWCYKQITEMGSVMCELLRKKKYKKLIHVSTSEVYGTAEIVPMPESHPWNSRTSYAAAKGAVDLMIKSYVATFGVDAIVLRPFNNYGPRQNDGNYAGVIPIFINNKLQNKNSTIFGNGEQSRDFIYVEDTASIICEISKANVPKGEIVNIASGQEVSIKDIYDTVYENTSQPLYAQERIGDVRRHFASTEKLSTFIGELTFQSFNDGMKKTIKWYENK